MAGRAARGEPRLLLREQMHRRLRPPSIPQRESLVTASLLALMLLPFLAQLLHGDLVRGHDDLSYMPRLVEMHENVRHGILLPRWAPDLGSGHGQPLFVFAPPFLYWLGEFWHLLGFHAQFAVNLAIATMVVGAALSMHRLAAGVLGREGARLAAFAYVFVPYLSVELFVRHAAAELAAFPLCPLVLDGLLRHDATGRRRWLAQSALALAALACAHPPAALLFAPLPPALAIALAWRRRSARALALPASALLAGLLVAAFSWLPGLVEKRHVKIDRLLEHPTLRYDIHFVEIRQLIASAWGTGLSVDGPADGLSFELGRVHLVLGIVALVGAWRLPALAWLRAPLVACAVTLITTCFFMLEASRPLWDGVRTLQYVQFEWRLLAVAAIPLALLAGAAAPVLLQIGDKGRLALTLAVLALLAVNLPHVQARRLPLDRAQWTPEQLAIRGVSVTTADEYEPVSVERPQPYGPDHVVASPGIAVLDWTRGPESARATVDAGIAGEVWFRSYDFPGWTAMIDGRDVPHRVAEPSGFLVVDVVPGSHVVEVELRRTPVQRAGLALSAAGVLAIVALVSVRSRARLRPD